MLIKRYWKKRTNKFTKNIWTRGPFTFYRSPNALNISLTKFDNKAFGWEYGYSDEMRGVEKPIISIRVGKLAILYFELWRKGFEIRILGFWLIR